MNSNVIAFLICVATFSVGCSHKENNRLEEALSLAGENRTELEKVLNRYAANPADTLKYRAACFLIENMPGYYYYEGKALDDWAVYFKCLDDNAKKPEEIIDSLSSIYGAFDVGSLKIKYDIETLDSAFLCDNIDRAFETWREVPWGKSISFADFCEYLLPYRFGNEKPVAWRKKYRELYADSLKYTEKDDAVSAAIILRDAILKKRKGPRFTMIRPQGYPNPDAFTADDLNGSCDDVNQFTAFAFRAAGIPCAGDYMPVRGNENVGHSWVSLKNSQNEYYTIDYFGNINYLSDTDANRRATKAKVYRRTFSKNRTMIDKLRRKTQSVPVDFCEDAYRFQDVTRLYSNYVNDLFIPDSLIYDGAEKQTGVLYLCIPSKLEWIPVDWVVASKKGEIVFTDVEAGCLYRVGEYADDTFTFLTDPFTVRKQTREIKTYASREEDKPLVLFSKYSLEGENLFRDRMIGGAFEASANASFRNPDTLFVIKSKPFRLYHRVEISTGKAYRYVRYKGPKNSFCNVSEIQFFSDTLLLKGKVIGTPGCWQNDGSHEYTNAFDGKTETSFDHNTASDGWTGLDLGRPCKITKIIYSPRNNDNYIKKGNTCELFTVSREGWQSLGAQTASSDSLRYDVVSGKGLYYIKCHSEGNQERPFILEDGKMIFL